MKRRFVILLSVLSLQSCLFSVWASPGSWRSHFAYHNATQCVALHEKVYVVSDASLYSYTVDDGLVECYDKSNILSDRSVKCIAACEKSNTLVVIYENANIDFIRPDGDVVNITDYLYETSLDPRVNDLRIINGKAYLSTNFGVTVLDVEREEFGETYMFDKVVYSCVELDGFIYAATEEGIYAGDKCKNLLDKANWTLLNSGVYTQLEVFEKQLLALKSKESVYSISFINDTATVFRQGGINYMHKVEEKLVVGNKTYVYLYTTSTDFRQLTFDGTVNSFTANDDVYWTSNGTKGLNGYQYNEMNKSVVRTVTGIAPNSPIRNFCHYLDVTDDGRLLVAGGNLNYFDYSSQHRTGTLMMYEDGEWKSFEESISGRISGIYRNLTSIVQDPKEPNHHYASSFGQGIFEFRDMKFVRQYMHQENQSGLKDVVASSLESAVPSSSLYTRISRLKYDKQGNLWISNADGGANVSSPLKIIKPDGKFVNLYYEELDKLPTVTEVVISDNGWIWVVSMRDPSLLFCIDTNGTLENTADDRVRRFSEKFVDQDGGSVEVYSINDIAEDLNGDIWVMTDKGPYVLYNTEKVFDDNYHFTKVKVPRNDGTNYADYLLDGACTTSIEVDAANRKWIGTLNNGLYLVSSDGLETLHHFTSENTPLPSNAVESLALNHLTGELFIGTEKGIVSYASDATQGVDEFDEEKVYAYPNPVASYYDGLITIVGLKSNSHVKIVNTAGRLITEGTSLGGAFTWDGCTPQGQRVSTGIYYVLGSDEKGKEGVVTKVLFIK